MSNITFLGNPQPHTPVTEGGRVIGHWTPDEAEPSVTAVHWQPDVASDLRRYLPQIEDAFSDSRSDTITRVLTGEGLEPWEVATKHVLIAVSAHAHSGITWVAAEDDKLASAIAAIFGATVAPKGTSEALQLAHVEGQTWDEIAAGIKGPTALKTKKGVGVIAEASFGTAAQPAALNYVALTANTEAPAATDTTLTGEITTASGGLIRKQASFAFTESTGVATLTITFAANASDTLPVTVAKFGVFNKATSGGTMGIETKLASTVTFSAVEDNMTLTETLTIT